MSEKTPEVQQYLFEDPNLKLINSLAAMVGKGSLSMLSGKEAEELYALLPELSGHIQSIRGAELQLKLMLLGMLQELEAGDGEEKESFEEGNSGPGAAEDRGAKLQDGRAGVQR